jgi:hypothetical protein
MILLEKAGHGSVIVPTAEASFAYDLETDSTRQAEAKCVAQASEAIPNGQRLVQSRSRLRGLRFWLLSHPQRSVDRAPESESCCWATSEATGRRKFYFDCPVLQRRHNSRRKFYLNDAVHCTVAGYAIKKYKWGAAALDIPDPALSTDGRGSLRLVRHCTNLR